MQININKNEKYYRNWILLVAFLLILCPLLHISVRSIPYVYNDEFGYWASAAYFTGKDWSSVFSNISYYSYGYSFILALILRIVGKTTTAYKIALVLNGLWQALSFLLLYKIGEKIYPKVQRGYLIGASLVAVLFSANWVEVNYTWPESFLFFLYCFIVYEMLRVIEYPTAVRSLIMGFLVTISYYVHQRTLGIVIAAGCVMTLLCFMKKITLKQYLAFVLTLVICMGIGICIKDNVIEAVWHNGSVVNGNNFAGQSKKIKAIFSFVGIKKLFLSACGKLYYVFAATFFMVPLAIWRMAKKMISGVKKRTFDNQGYIYMFLIISFIFSWGINSVAMLTPGNVTHIVYGRYIDNIFGPFLLIAMIEWGSKKITMKENIIHIAVFSWLSLMVWYCLHYYDLLFQAAVNNAGIAYMVDTGNIELIKGFAFVVGIWCVIQWIRYVIHRKAFAYVCCMTLLLGVFFVIGQKAYTKFELDWSKASVSSADHAALIEELRETYGEIEIYAVLNIQGDFPGIYAGNGIQFLLQDEEIQMVYIDDVKAMDWSENAVILSHNSLGELEGFTVISVDETYELLVKNEIFNK